MRKRWLISGLLVAGLAAAYTGYWFWLARTFEQNLALWIDQQRAAGYRISYGASEPSGFPLPVHIGLTGVTIEPTASAVPWRIDAESVGLSIAPWAPLSLQIDNTARQPDYRVRWRAGDGDHDVALEGLRVVLRLSGEGGPPSVIFPTQSVSLRDGDHARVNIGQFSGDIGVFDAGSHVDSSLTFNLSASCVNFLHLAAGKTVETYDWQISGRVMGRIPSEPLAHALAAWSNGGGYLELTRLEANWEAVTDVSVNGSVALDRQLQPIASMTVRLRNYAELIDWLASIGAIDPERTTAAKLALAAMSRPATDGTNAMEAQVPITIQNGYLSIGAIKVAPIAKVVWP